MSRITLVVGSCVVALLAATVSWGELRSSAASVPLVVAVIDSIGSPAAPGSAEPNLAVAPDGRVYMSWIEPADSGHALCFAVLDGATLRGIQALDQTLDRVGAWADRGEILHSI